jgi:PAS domain S-box-containing protein
MTNYTLRQDLHERRDEHGDTKAVSGPTPFSAFRARITLAFARNDSLQETLQCCATVMREHLDLALVRIWLLDKVGKVLELQASAGISTHLNGPHGRAPIGEGKIGRIAHLRQPYFTNAVIGDPAIHNQDWAQREGLVSFAGVPLLIGERLIGVMACFARIPFTSAMSDILLAEAYTIALGVDHKQTAEALQKSESSFRSLIEHALDILVVLNSDGTIRYTGPSFTRVLGWTPGELLDSSMFTFVHPDDVPATLAALSDVILHPDRIVTIETRVLHRDGSWRHLEAVSRSFVDDPDVGGVIVNARDITDRKRMLLELEENRLHMVQAAKLTELGEMATSIAHELNQPLTAIKMAADLLLRTRRTADTPAPAMLHQMLEKISVQVERATAIISHMRALGHPPTGVCAPLHVNTVVRSALALLEHQLRAHDIAVHLTLDEHAPPILGEQIPLEQVLIALINNARDAMHEEAEARSQRGQLYEKRLAIDTAVVAGHVRLTITDNGPGISAETQQRIFAPFFTTKGVGKGTGLGLSVSHRIIQQYDGVLAVESSEGAGATFILQFPPLNEETAFSPLTQRA